MMFFYCMESYFIGAIPWSGSDGSLEDCLLNLDFAVVPLVGVSPARGSLSAYWKQRDGITVVISSPHTAPEQNLI